MPGPHWKDSEHVAERLIESTSQAARQPRTDSEARPKQSELLLQLVEIAGVEVFSDETHTSFARVPVGGHREVWPLHSRGFSSWLRHQYYREFEKSPNPQAIATARDQLDAHAQFNGDIRRVFVRVAEYAGRIYVDLGTSDWTAIEVTDTGWGVVENPPVMFQRGPGSAPLPLPSRSDSVAQLRKFVRVDDDDWPLIVGWLAACLRPTGPYPILILQGEQGSAKSTTARMLRALVDPSAAALRSAPRNEQDLMVAAATNWVLCLDNLSSLPGWLSDCLCRLVTGSAFSTRELFTDRGEVLITAQRPIIMNGIEELAEREDLRDRALIVHLSVLPDRERRDERSVWTDFGAMAPGILGSLLDAVSEGLATASSVRLERPPRMADFARWGVACESGLGLAPDAFLRSYTANRRDAVALSLEDNPVAQAVVTLAAQGSWSGTATELLERLSRLVSAAGQHARDLPKSPKVLSTRLTRAAPMLRMAGVAVERDRDNARRLITIYRLPASSVTCVTDGHRSPSPGDRCSQRGPALSVLQAGPVLPSDAGDARMRRFMICANPDGSDAEDIA